MRGDSTVSLGLWSGFAGFPGNSSDWNCKPGYFHRSGF